MVRLAVTLNEFPDETFEFAFESLEERKDMFLFMLETGRESQTDPAAECGRTLQGSILLCPHYSPEGKERQYTIGHDRRCRCLRHAG